MIGAIAAVQAVWVSIHKFNRTEPLLWTLQPLVLLSLPSLAFFAGGVSLISGGGGGLYWILAATILAFLAASVNAWVLLVEILR
ncbi:MAG: hypothetical protein WDN07_00055 [Actinomycetota bacterium]